jgi:hypothetical protein
MKGYQLDMGGEGRISIQKERKPVVFTESPQMRRMP